MSCDLPAILVAFLLGPLVPYLAITEDTSSAVSVDNVVVAADDPPEREVLKLERDPVLHPVRDIGRERQPALDAQQRVRQMDLQGRANGARVKFSRSPRLASTLVLVCVGKADDPTVTTSVHGGLEVVVVKLALTSRMQGT